MSDPVWLKNLALDLRGRVSNLPEVYSGFGMVRRTAVDDVIVAVLREFVDSERYLDPEDDARALATGRRGNPEGYPDRPSIEDDWYEQDSGGGDDSAEGDDATPVQVATSPPRLSSERNIAKRWATLNIPNPYRPDTIEWVAFENGQVAALANIEAGLTVQDERVLEPIVRDHKPHWDEFAGREVCACGAVVDETEDAWAQHVREVVFRRGAA